jgi:hypothetical protein
MKRFMTIIIVLFIFTPFFGCSSNESTGNYERLAGGKDTEITFGDGRFSVDYNKRNKPYYLMDRKKSLTIDLITKYCTISPYLYSIGEKGYTKISYQLGIYYTSSNLETFDKNDQAVFKLLESSSDKIPYHKDIYNRVQRDDDQKGPLAYLDNKGLYAVYQRKLGDYTNQYELISQKNNQVIEFITKYKIFNSCIYTIGKQGYTKINLNNIENPYSQSQKLDDFNNDDQIVFKILEAEDSIFLELRRY